MDNYFYYYLLLSFLTGGIWIAVVTVLAERFGSKLGGFIAGMPSTSLVTFLFIGLTQGAVKASEATTVFPLMVGTTGLFLAVYALLIDKGLAKALGVAILTWLGLSFLVVASRINIFSFSLIIFLFFFLLSLYIFREKIKVTLIKGQKVIYTLRQILGRAIFGGVVITSGVFLAKVGGLVFGGIFAAFPATFISTLTIIYFARGVEFSRSFAYTMMVTGLSVITLYGIAVRYTYPLLGLWWGTVFSLALSMLASYFVFQFLKHKTQ